MQGPDFLYFFTDSTNRSFYVENGALVKLSSVPRALQFTPGEWQNISIDNARNQKYFALDRNFSVPLSAVEDGAMILKDQYYKFGIEAVVNLVILKQHLFYDGTQYGYHYKSFYKGELDFSTFVHAGPQVTINVMEGGLSKLIKARENIVYELDMDVPENEHIRWNGIVLKQSARYANVAVTYTGTSTSAHMLPIAFIAREGDGAGALTKSQGATLDSSDYFYKATQAVTVQLAGSIKFKANAQVLAVILTLRKTNSGAGGVVVLQQVYNPYAANTEITYAFNVAIPLVAGQSLYFTGDAVGPNINSRSLQYFETTITATFSAALPETLPRVLPPLYVFKKLIEKITDGAYLGDSTLLTQFSTLKLICGDSLRGFENAKMRLSLNDFFQSYNGQLDIGMGPINGIVRLEDKSFFVDYLNPIPLGSARALKVKPDTEKFFTTLKIGSPNQTYNDVNGRQEFNTTAEFSSPMTRVAKELNLVSVFRTDAYGAEFHRINFEGKTTTDAQGDNDIWIIHTEALPTSYITTTNKPIYKFDRSLNASVSGLLEPTTIFNLYLNPKFAFRRCGSSIRACFYKQDSSKLIFQTIDKNRDVSVQGELIIADVQIGSLKPALYTPNVLEFEIAAPIDLVEMLEASPVRAFSFDYLGIPLKGIPVKVGIRPADNASQTFTLLSGPDNDLTQLINIFE